ncbi:hypothetical protein [Nocardia pseudovaccinii]|uniref:hypothetical protein n=1 Tax=Nocardia pseudovaccinii TaxID=189540 RepID=UPI000AF22855|nr:hypothetical protein [Nocardia pseudovaccinii]
MNGAGNAAAKQRKLWRLPRFSKRVKQDDTAELLRATEKTNDLLSDIFAVLEEISSGISAGQAGKAGISAK